MADTKRPALGAQSYNTQLSPQQEAAFQLWLMEQSKRQGRDLAGDLQDYDLRGYWAGQGQQAENGHMTDQFKKPNHPTFSDESQYSGTGGYIGGHWGQTRRGQDQYVPSPQMFAGGTHNLPDMLRYFAEAEPDARLQLPPMDMTGMGNQLQQAAEVQRQIDAQRAAKLKRR